MWTFHNPYFPGSKGDRIMAEKNDPPPPPPPITKRIPESVKTIALFAKLTYKILRATKQLEFMVVKTDPMTGKPVHGGTHTVSLTDAEMTHLNKGGKIIAVHLCGYQEHVRM